MLLGESWAFFYPKHLEINPSFSLQFGMTPSSNISLSVTSFGLNCLGQYRCCIELAVWISFPCGKGEVGVQILIFSGDWGGDDLTSGMDFDSHALYGGQKSKNRSKSRSPVEPTKKKKRLAVWIINYQDTMNFPNFPN